METKQTKDIKARLLKHYRFEKGYYVGQEVEQKDIFAINKELTEAIEVEIKVSKADLQNELHKSKHYISHQLNRPTKYYFCVPPELEESTREIIQKLNKNEYGIIDANTLNILKRAKHIDNKLVHKMLPILCKRLSSDVANKYNRMLHIEDNLKTFTTAFILERCEFITDKHQKSFIHRFYTRCFKEFDSNTMENIKQTVNQGITTIKYDIIEIELSNKIKCNKYYQRLNYREKDNRYNLNTIDTLITVIQNYNEHKNKKKEVQNVCEH